jgi:predicted tellurium resistance membrane protein TerC
MEMFLLFIALFLLEGVLEIDNLTALQKAAAGLPNTPWCRGQVPHALALGVRVGLVYLLFHGLAYFTAVSTSATHNTAEQFGGLLLIIVAIGLVFNYLRSGVVKRPVNVSRQKSKPTSLFGFLIADAFLSLDTVIAAVAMTTSFNLAVAAMVSASAVIMLFHEPLHVWLKANPRVSLIAFVIIGLMGVNLILDGHGIHIPKIALLAFVFLGIWFDDLDKKLQKMRAEDRARYKKTMTSGSSWKNLDTHLVQTIKGVDKSNLGESGNKIESAAEPKREELKQCVLTAVPAEKSSVSCSACGVEQKPNSSICHNCGQYRFFNPGIVESIYLGFARQEK